jgi:phenylacetate-CoA ligase
VALDPRAYAAGFDARVASFLPEAAARVPALAERIAAAGLAPEDLTDTTALVRLPVLTKDELIARQAERPPFGDNLAAGAHPRRVFASPGPIYEPEPDRPDHWRFAPALQAAGFTADDVVLNAFGYHLSPAGAMFEEACRAIGCTVVPGGVGNREAQARACADLGVSAYIGLPSYLKALLDTAGLPIQKAFVTAEPLPPSLRAWLRERVPTVLQGYGTAEAGNLGHECPEMNGLHVPADALVQVCDLDDGVALHDEAEGQVVTTVFSADYRWSGSAPTCRPGRMATAPAAGRPRDCVAGWGAWATRSRYAACSCTPARSRRSWAPSRASPPTDS